MKLLVVFLGLFLSSALCQNSVQYGDNIEVGNFITINEVQLYYEIYGEGEPLLLIHGNKTGISGWKPQIEEFSKYYKVIAIDCRGRGKSELGKDSLSYLQTANDISVFIKKMELDSVNILGKSDGGIVGLILGIHFPENIKRIISFGANISPDSTALYPEVVNEIHLERIHAEKMLLKKDTTENWNLAVQRIRMMEFQPHISADDLKKIKVPVLIMSCDRDLIKEEHSLFIYKNIPNSNLSIFPGEFHAVTRQNPELFNKTILDYVRKPFIKSETRF